MVAFTYRLGDSGERSPFRRPRTGSSSVLFLASSLRSLARSQPPCTNVSLPSGRSSLIVTCRSTFLADERTQACTAPAPTTVVALVSGAVANDTAVPAGSCVHLYGGVAVQSPSLPPAVSPVKSVSGRAWAFQVNVFAPAFAGRAAPSAPFGPRYQDCALVPGIGKLGHDCSKAGYG